MAAAHRNGIAFVTEALDKLGPASRNLLRREGQQEAATGIGLLALLRALEQKGGDKPRIGRNLRLRDALVRMGQDPFLSFPASDLSRMDDSAGAPAIRAQFLGFYGAFGALPLNWTAEVNGWFETGDEAFPAFTDIFTARFQELFFRAWSDSHPITQFDHPDDRFQTYLLSLLGVGTPAFQRRMSVSDTALAHLTPLAMGRVKSPVRLRQMLEVHFGSTVLFEVEELVISWLEFHDDELSRLGMQAAVMGQNVHLGARAPTCIDKIRLHIHVPTLTSYRRFLPGGPDFEQMRDIVFWYLGQAYDIEAVLWLPEPQVEAAVLGQSTQLAWMACIAPDPGNPNHQITATKFHLTPDREAAAPVPHRISA